MAGHVSGGHEDTHRHWNLAFPCEDLLPWGPCCGRRQLAPPLWLLHSQCARAWAALRSASSAPHTSPAALSCPVLVWAGTALAETTRFLGLALQPASDQVEGPGVGGPWMRRRQLGWRSVGLRPASGAGV